MASIVYVHIGQPKTGSTALQRALVAHPGELAVAGVTYPVAHGRVNHIGELADLHLQRIPPTAGREAAYARLVRAAAPGSWQRLLERVTGTHDRVIVSDETLSSLTTTGAQRVVDDLTGGAPGKAQVVLVIRPLSVLLASAYGQLALDTVLPNFDLWVRVWLGVRLRRPHTETSSDWTDGFQVVRIWAATGAEVACVRSPADSAQHWSGVFDALGLGVVRDQIVAPRANPSMSALGVAAWQQYLRSGIGPHGLDTKRLRKVVRRSLPEIDDAALGGQLSLTPEVAELVDAAFPQPTPGRFPSTHRGAAPSLYAEEGGRAFTQLAQRLLDPRPLTTQPLIDRAEDIADLSLQIGDLARACR